LARHHRRHGRQQFLRRALAALRQHARERAGRIELNPSGERSPSLRRRPDPDDTAARVTMTRAECQFCRLVWVVVHLSLGLGRLKLERLARSEMPMSRNHMSDNQMSRQHLLVLGAAAVAIVVLDAGLALAGSSRGWTNRNWYPQLTSR